MPKREITRKGRLRAPRHWRRMSAVGAARKLLDEALALPAEDRAALVDALSASLEPVELTDEVHAEIRRRIEAIEAGQASVVSWDEVRAHLRAKLRER